MNSVKRKGSVSLKLFGILTAVVFLLPAIAGFGPGVASANTAHGRQHPALATYAKPSASQVVPQAITIPNFSVQRTSADLVKPMMAPPNDLSGSGTADDPYQIRSAGDLNSINYYNSSSVAGQVYYYKLMQSVDISVYTNWEPIGNEAFPFTGNFDGNGCTISGLTIDDTTGLLTDAGLFGYVGNGAVIQNTNLTGASVTGTGVDVTGGLAGENYGLIRASSVSGSVSGPEYTGGLAGYNYGGITQSSAAETPPAAGVGAYFGGLVGYNDTNGGIESCSATVSGNVTGLEFIGGLAGWSSGSISNSSATVNGNITAFSVIVNGSSSGGDAVGGLVGASAGSITGSSATVNGNIAAFSVIVNGSPSGGDAVGGLAGESLFSISSSSVTVSGSVYGSHEVGGLVGKCSGNVSDSYATVGNVAGADDIGGLAGEVLSGMGVAEAGAGAAGASAAEAGISGSHASVGSVAGQEDVGGLVGWNSSGGNVSNSFATVTSVYGTEDSTGTPGPFGGLVGVNLGTIAGSNATGNVSGTSDVGGLVGVNAQGSISNSYAAGTVTGTGGNDADGGLVGVNLATIAGSYATGNVSGTSEVGGLVGVNAGGSISNSYAAGTVTGTGGADADGGLVGLNLGTIAGSHATGNVSGTYSVGGLVGQNDFLIDNSYAAGTVTGTGGQDDDGGLVGDNVGTISGTAAYGGVSGTSDVGGLAGFNVGPGSINTSYAIGSVSGSGGDDWDGGLVGHNDANISNCYASVGSVSGTGIVGGLVGENDANISNCYAAGAVSLVPATGSTSVNGAGAQFVGGLAGLNGTLALITGSYWDTDTTRQALGAGSNQGSGTWSGEPTTQMIHQATFTGWDFTGIWGINEGYSYPYLLAAPYPIPAVTGVEPTSGPPAGGTAVAIYGTDLSTVIAVYFGDDNQASFNVGIDSVSGATYLAAVSPAGSGIVDIVVRTPAGASATSSGDRFTYTGSNNNGGGGGGGGVTVPVPTLTAGTVTAGSVVINMSDTASVVSFNLYENGSATPVNASAITAGGNQATYTVTGLAAATTYTFTANAKDASGNESGMSAGLSVTTAAGPAQSSLTFSDVPPGFWAHDDIYSMADKGYVHGIGGGLFAPNAPITRAQFVTILTSMLGLTGQGSVPFPDVSPTAWYYQSVALAYKAGLIVGFSPAEFGPDLPITREQMAEILARVLTYKGVSVQVNDPQKVLSVFEDAATIDQWAVGSVAVAVQEGLMQGLPPGDGGRLFEPLASTTRAQATVILLRLLSLI